MVNAPSVTELCAAPEATTKKEEILKEVSEYEQFFEDDDDSKKRKANYMTMVNNFYDLVTSFYEYGWGQCFHFAPRFKGESFNESIMRTDYFLASQLNLRPGMKVLDVGCGVGGPLRNIAKFSGAGITGINNNAYQIARGTKALENEGLSKTCNFVKCDFMNIALPDGSYDAAYAIEATCHSPNKVGVFSEIFRCLKPGGMFACLEWVMTPKYDSNNPEHVRIKKGIEHGNSLPDICSIQHVVDCMKEAGFEVIDHFDLHKNMHSEHEIPWYEPLTGKLTLGGFRHTYMGRTLTHVMVSTLETAKLAPAGTTRVSKILNDTAICLVQGGQTEIFSPDYFVLVRKPL